MELKYLSARNKSIAKRTLYAGIGFISILFAVGMLFTLLPLNSDAATAASCTECNTSYSGATGTSMDSQAMDANAAPGTNTKLRVRTTNDARWIAAVHIAQSRVASSTIATVSTNNIVPFATLNPGGIPDYFGTTPNYVNSPLPTADPANGAVSGGIRKFVDSLPGVGPSTVPGRILFGQNNLGKYIPLAQADNTTYLGSEYYEIGLVQYTEKMHSDLKPTLLRGYVQLSTVKVPGAHIALINPDGTPVLNATGGQVYAVDNPHYMGPLIYAHKDTPVRVKFTNFLPTGAGGNLFLPVDTTVIGSGIGPNATDPNTNGGFCNTNLTHPNTPPTCYAQNRATIHLHGGNTPWISDGTQDQWTTPAGENTQYPKGVTTRSVPDMDNGYEPNGTISFYYTNQQSARLMFYHDHAYGITRLNVYAGVAGPYILDDPVETGLENAGILPAAGDEAPLIIQDKTYLPDAAQLAAEDPTWPFVLNTSRSDLWFPHVYMPNQNMPVPNGTAIAAAMATNPMGRWDYGPWTFPPVQTAVNYTSFPNPLYNASISLCTNVSFVPCEYIYNPGVTIPSMVPEAFVDTTVINGNAYPYLNVGQKAYEFELLDAANDRGYNLQLYYASTAGPFARFANVDGNGSGASASLTVDANGTINGYTITSGGAGYTLNPNVSVFDAPGHIPAGSGTIITAGVDLNASNITTFGTVVNLTIVNGGINYSVPTLCKGPIAPSQNLCTEIAMVPAVPGAAAFPANDTNPNGNWTAMTGNATFPYAILDGRVGGIPDPASIGPNMIQIKNEAGFLPAPVVIPNRPVGMDYKNFLGPGFPLNVREKALFLDPAERAEVVVDFSQVPDNSTLILYNDAPTPVTGSDPRYDYFTDNPDNTPIGGAPSTIPGYGPNIRTLLQIRVNGSIATAPPFNMTNLTNALPGAYAQVQPKPLVPEANYSTAFNTTYTSTYVGFNDTNITFTPANSNTSVTLNLTPKSINDAFDMLHGTLYTSLGVELPATRTPIAYNHWDPPTEIIKASDVMVPIGTLGDGTQIWRVYSNSVDTHPMHWHMFNVQVINRIGQLDGMIKPPDPNELGWKETLRMNPLEDVIVAVRPIIPNLPWDLPNNIRPLDVTAPLGSLGTMGIMGNMSGFSNIDPSNQTANVTNHLVNFGWEYVWHCHILGHEEMMIMRPQAIVVKPNAPLNLTAANSADGVVLTWIDNSINEINWTIRRAQNISGPWTNFTVQSATGPDKGTNVTYNDTTVGGNTTYYYQVMATNIVGDTTVYPVPAAGYPNMAVDSPGVNTSITTGTIVFFDDVESGTNGWTSTGLWHITTKRSNSPTHAWWYGQESTGNYYVTVGKESVRNSGNLTSQPINLSEVSNPILSFTRWYQVEGNCSVCNPVKYDQMIVLISDDNGSTWTQLIKILDSPYVPQWKINTIDLSNYAGKTIKIRFYFDTIDAVENKYEGWYIDDVKVETLTPLIPLYVSVSESPDPVASGNSSVVTVHVSTSGGVGVSNAFMNVGATGGILSPSSGTTDTNGDFIANYTAPTVASNTTYTISATASKTGYVSGSGNDTITVYTSHNPDIIFFDNVESGINGWTSTGLWHITTKRYNSPGHSWWYGQESTGNYDTPKMSNSGFLTSKEISLAGTTTPRLSFMTWYITEPDIRYDIKVVQVSQNNGSTWTTLKQISGPQSTWYTEYIDLSNYTNTNIIIRFYFDTKDSLYNKYEGWYIDDVKVENLVPR